MKRVLSVWLPTFATDRLERQSPARAGGAQAEPPIATVAGAPPVATVAGGRGGIGLIAVNRAAWQQGLRPGLALADARALVPELGVHASDPAGDRRRLAAFADGCGRYTPWTAIDESCEARGRRGGGAGLWLDISGCAHLCGGEAALLGDLIGRFARLGFTATAAIAPYPGAAWALARFTAAGAAKIVVPADVEALLAPLPVAALRLPAAILDGLGCVGLRRIGELLPLPRAPLAARFGEILLTRLDQALGAIEEPLSPRRPVPPLTARLAFAEPIGRGEDIAAAVRHLLADLCARLAAAHQGVRRLELACYRTCGTAVRCAIGTSRPNRAPAHLERLLREPLERIDPGFGIETMVLAAGVVEPLAPEQPAIGNGDCAPGDGIAPLIDRLANRLGTERVVRLRGEASHLPERACQAVPALTEEELPSSVATEGGDQRPGRPRPLLLLPSPEVIEVIAPVPDGPPVLMRWRRRTHRIAAAEGPERIAPEWWRQPAGLAADGHEAARDYYRVEDADGRRFWVYREGLYRPDRPPRWFVHGVFA